MSKQMIPNTDNPTVALIAAALHLAETAAGKNDTFDDKLARFREAYQALSGLVEVEPRIVATIPPAPTPAAPAFPAEPPVPVYHPVPGDDPIRGM